MKNNLPKAPAAAQGLELEARHYEDPGLPPVTQAAAKAEGKDELPNGLMKTLVESARDLLLCKDRPLQPDAVPALQEESQGTNAAVDATDEPREDADAASVRSA